MTNTLMETIRQTRIIVTHENCADGLASALLLHNVLPNAEVRFVQHGTAALKDMKAEPHMLFCDIAPPADRVSEFVAAGAVVLDHHKTAKATVEAFGSNGVFADETTEPGVSGAMLAFRVWDALVGSCSPIFREWVRNFATLTGVRDTWQNQHALWDAACRQGQVLHMVPQTVWMSRSLESIAEGWDREFKWLGDVLTERHQKSVEKSVRGGTRLTSEKGTRVILFNNLTNTSDAAELLADTVDVVVGFSYENENGLNKLIFSTRSHTTFDCSAFCKANGGGGHTKAAGCSLVDDGTAGPCQTFMRLLNAFESTR